MYYWGDIMFECPIGIFDSGLGGLTVMKEIVKALPNEDIVYFGDTGRVPYGTRSRETIKKYAKEDASFLLSHNVKAVVAACGTVSAVAADTANILPVPFFEMISPAVNAAVRATKNKKIGIIGTPATVRSGEHKKRILEILPDAEIFATACPLFVPLVEEGLTSAENLMVVETAKKYLLPLKEKGIDTLILGCTHYPLLSEVIASVLGEGVTLINPAEELSGMLKAYLTDNNLLNERGGAHNYYVSDMTVSFESTAENLMGEKISPDNAKQVDISKI